MYFPQLCSDGTVRKKVNQIIEGTWNMSEFNQRGKNTITTTIFTHNLAYKNPNLAITLGECNSFRCDIKLIKIYKGRPIVNATRKNNTTGKNVDHRGLPISKLMSSLKKDRPFKLITLK